MADEDFFLDDDLDAIPDSTLQALEQNALRSTQHAAPLRGPQNRLHRPWQPPRPRSQNQQQLRDGATSGLSAGFAAPPIQSRDVSFDLEDEENVVDLAGSSMVIRPGPRFISKKLDPATVKAFAAADEELGAIPSGNAFLADQQAHQDGPMQALLQRVADLEAQQTRLRESEQAAIRAAEAKQGEIQIVRANQDKIKQAYESRVQALQKQHALEVAEQKTKLDASVKERERMQTDNRFLQHDLAQSAERARHANGGRAARTAEKPETPKKSRRGVLGDGFDDDEVRMVSPSRSKDKSREQTPRAGIKRRRLAHDSPTSVLPVAPPVELKPERTDQSFTSAVDLPLRTLAAASLDEQKYDFFQRLLSHQYNDGEGPTMEILAKHHFRSDSHHSVATLFLDELAVSDKTVQSPLPIRVARCLLHLWSRCLDEEAYGCFLPILDLLEFSLLRERMSSKSQLIEEAVPLCLRAIDLTVVPSVRASTNPSFAATLDHASLESRSELVPVDGVLPFLQDLCGAATLSVERIEAFWHCMAWDFLLMMLHKIQPVRHMITTLQIIKTSALSTTFGVIHKNPQKQSEQERILIDRLTNLMFEVPEAPSDEPPYSDGEILELRIEILGIFRELCLTRHGETSLSRHKSVIGRLVRFLDQQVCQLYIVPPVTATAASHGRRHALTAQAINITTRILHHLICESSDAASINMGEKLQAVMGGYHKFLTSLTRIAFTEQLVFEAGIANEVAEAAHAVLDSVLGPEDGEAVMRAIETPRGSKDVVEDAERLAESSRQGKQRNTVPDPG